MQKIAKATKKYVFISLLAIILGVGGAAAIVNTAFADAPVSQGCGSACCGDPGTVAGSPCVPQDQLQKAQADAKAAADKTKGIKCPNNRDCGGIITKIINPFINLMTALVGVIVAISLVAAGITYSAAGGDPGKVSAAKKRITGSIIALIAYLFTFALLQWLVPGGLI